tara:strand:+ start:1801 stop:3549 length:1749 start_codon:yes stop_codon:yes gene_type:complete
MKSLQEYGIDLPQGSIGNHKAFCPQCRFDRKKINKHDKPLSVTIDAGSAVWNCHNCGWSGGFNADQTIHPIKKEFSRPKEPDQMIISEGIENFFRTRHISNKTVQAFGIYAEDQYINDQKERCIAFPYRVDGELINVKYRSQNKQFRQQKNAERSLFNIDRVKRHWEETGRKDLVFVEGEMDVLAFYEAGIKNAITLPDGAPKRAKFDQADKRFMALVNCEWIQDAEKIIIATDADEAGRALALELVHRFGKDRCWRIKWPESDEKDANELLINKGCQALREIIEAAEPYPIDGLYSVDNFRDQVLNIYHGETEQPLSTGFSILDSIYRIKPSTFHVVTGVPNHGKSNFIDQLAINMAQIHGWKFAIFSPEHSSPQHLRRLTEKVARKPFDIGPNERMSEEKLNSSLDFLEKHFHFINNKDEIPTISWILGKAKIACLRYGIRGLIIDPYNEINAERSNGKREDEHIRDTISECKAFCRQHEIVLWMIAHPAKMYRNQDGEIPAPSMYDISGASHWNNMADVGLVIHRDFEENITRVITRKIREQGLYGEIGECFFKYSLSTHCYEEWNPDQNNKRADHWQN